MRAGERCRASWATRLGWSAWLLRVVAWGLAGLGLVRASAGLGAMWRGVSARVPGVVVPGKGGTSEETPGRAGRSLPLPRGRLAEEASGPGRQPEEASGRGRALGGIPGLGRLQGGAAGPSRPSGGASDGSRRLEGVSNPSRRLEGAADPSRRPDDTCGPSGLPEASGVALREADDLARFRTAGCGDQRRSGCCATRPRRPPHGPFPAGTPDWDDRPHATADLHVCHPQAGVLRVCHAHTGVSPVLDRTCPSAPSSQPPHVPPLREAPATALRSPPLTANRSASVNRGVTRDRPVPFT
ncbi:hypothetical protein QF035_003191 [Streptomyces umbrinus]|uniref:Uncharacterized protein n=1 Tax=Streptomyces umbrinus TaxID=67370 RepID=A0ABU0SPX6_9ACTN|nr:hypothetical protein [Streptomyces umbrinus]